LNEENVLEVIVARKPDREDLFHWVGPIYPRKHWVFKLKTRTDVHVQSVDDAKRYTIGALLDTANYALFLEQGFEPGKNLIAVDTSESKLNMFLAGRIDLVSYLPLEAAYRLKLLGKSYELVEPLFLASGDLEYYFGLSKAIPEEIVQTLQYHLDEMKHDGTFEKIKHHYIEE
jgi:polar amino acid transport system substrate-binding protein